MVGPTEPYHNLWFWSVVVDWYDGWWWRCHAAARAWLVEHRADALEGFDAAIERLRPVPHVSASLLADGVPASFHDSLREAVAGMDPVRLESHELDSFGRHVVHDAFTPDLVAQARAILEPIVGLPLEPSYDFLSLYHGSGRCTPHLDAPNAGYTLDVCIEQSAPWPLLVRRGAPWIADTTGSVATPTLDGDDWDELMMEPGEAIVFSGTSVWHGRRAMPEPGGYCTLAFFHFIPSGTSDLVNPLAWAEVFDARDLAPIIAAV